MKLPNIVNYWKNRHRSHDRLKAVGRRNLSRTLNEHHANEIKRQLDDSLDDNRVELDGRNVLDAGSGSGRLSDIYRERGANLISLDISRTALHGCPPSRCCGSITSMPFDADTYDVVHCYSVLSHIVDEEAWRDALDEIFRVVKPGGYIVLGIHLPDHGSQPHDHIRFYSRDEYEKKLVRDFGCKVIELRCTPEIWGESLIRLLPEKLVSLMVDNLPLYRERRKSNDHSLMILRARRRGP